MPLNSEDELKRLAEAEKNSVYNQPIQTTFRRLVWAVVIGNFLASLIGLTLLALLGPYIFPT